MTKRGWNVLSVIWVLIPIISLLIWECYASFNLTSSEWAAWVQAVGSILAILGAAGIAVWQSKEQHSNSIKLDSIRQREAKVELAKTLLVLADNCSRAMTFLVKQINSRGAIYMIAEGHTYFDLGEILRIDSSISGIPLHGLPSSLVTPTMILSSTIRQFRNKIEQVLRVHRSMDAEAFADFFRVLDEMVASLNATRVDIESEVRRIQDESYSL